MSTIKKLAGQTVIYGFSSIIPRFLNWLLVPLYTYIFATSEYGIVTELYAYVTFFIIILTYGMETGFFRFSESGKNPIEVYSTSYISLLTTSLIFILAIILLKNNIASIIGYHNHPEYILYFGLILGIDAICAIPFAYLRQQQRPILFSVIKISNVGINIFFNVWFLFIVPNYLNYENSYFLRLTYNPNIGVGYIFISNLIASASTLLMLSKQIIKIKWFIDFTLLRKLLIYSLPLLVSGLAGTVNETLDRVLLKHLYPDQGNALSALGIYGANFKLGVIMVLFIQAFRYAAEPFFFSYYKNENSTLIYARIMKYFILFCLIIFLSITMFIDVIQYFIGSNFREGLSIVPIILFAYMLYGIFFNLSIWYKLKNVTKYGAYLTIIGSVVTIFVNVFFIPKYGYYASAWGHFFSYMVMVILSYFIGKRFLKINYEIKNILVYIIICLSLYFIGSNLNIHNVYISFALRSFILISFIIFVVVKEKLYSQFIRHES